MNTENINEVLMTFPTLLKLNSLSYSNKRIDVLKRNKSKTFINIYFMINLN